jgi:hypothetical protein
MQQGRFYNSTTSSSGIEVGNCIAAANSDAAVMLLEADACALSLLLQLSILSLC